LKTETHTILGGGVSLLSASQLGVDAACLAAAWGLGSLIHPIIDRFSHARSRRGVYRTKLLHSFETAIPLSAALGLATGSLVGLGCALALAAALSLSALSHLLTDMVTPGGVYLMGRRVSVPIFRWDDPAANSSLSVAGLMMMFIAVALST